MKRIRFLMLAVGLFIAGISAAFADQWWIQTGSGYRSIGGAATLGPYSSQAEAEAVNRQSFNNQATITRTASPSGGNTSSGVYSSDPRVEAAGQIGNAIGQAIGKAIMGDPQAVRNEGLALNNQGIQYCNNRQWQLAVNAFTSALGKCPDDQTIRQNLEYARQALIKEEQEAQARKKQEIYDRLASRLKLSEGSDGNGGHLTLEDVKTGDDGGFSLKDLKMGDSDSDSGHVGVRGLPGIYLNDDTGKGSDKPYGIPGLPGIYVNGPGSGSGIAQPGETKPQMTMGDNTPPATSANNTRNVPPNDNEGNGINSSDSAPGSPGVNTTGTDSGSEAASAEKAKLQVMAGDDGAPPGQANTDSTQPTPSTETPGTAESQTTIASVPAALQQQAAASQAAAVAPSLEDASAKARSGFDTPLPGKNMAPVQLGSGTHGSVTAVPSTPEAAPTAAVPVGAHNFNFPSAPQPSKATPATKAASATTTAPAETATSNQSPLTREQLQAWIKHLTNEIHGLQILLQRLDRTEMHNQQDRTNWVDELNQATDRAWEHLGYLYLSQGLDGLSDRMEKMAKNPGITRDELNQLDRMQNEIQAATHTYSALQVTETLADEGSTSEKTLQNLHTTLSDILSTPAVQKVLKIHKGYADFFSAAKDDVDSMYDLRDVCESARQLAIQNNGSSEYLNRVNEIKSHMETIVKELKRARDTLANMDASAGTR
jgi:hypothetical protein